MHINELEATARPEKRFCAVSRASEAAESFSMEHRERGLRPELIRTRANRGPGKLGLGRKRLKAWIEMISEQAFKRRFRTPLTNMSKSVIIGIM